MNDRLDRLLGGPDLAWLVTRVRARLERGQPLDTSVTLTSATAAQRVAVQQLIGRRPHTGDALTVSLPVVDRILRQSGAAPNGLAAAVVALTGPVAVRAETASALASAWASAFAPIEAVIAEQPELQDWYATIHSTGLVRRLTGAPSTAAPILADLAAVLRQLPANGEPLGHFAARVTGSAHALDDNRPLSTLVVSAARTLSGISNGSGAEWRREIWASVGLLRDELSSTVLTLGLPGDPDTATGRALAAFHAAGQPVVLTLRQLVRDPPVVSASPIFACENPVVVTAAANSLGTACRPLVCTNGQPRAATMVLLRLFAASGADMSYHGDFDWPGLSIAATLFSRLKIRPWRFDAPSYETAVVKGHPLAGPAVPSPWDPALSDTMRYTGQAVEEELVLDTLLADLRRTDATD